MRLVRQEVRDLIYEVFFERFDDAEDILREKIDIAKEALWRVQMAQRPPGILGVGCGLMHEDGLTGSPVIDWRGEGGVDDTKQRVIEVFIQEPTRLFTSSGIAKVVGLTNSAADRLLSELESEGLIESEEFGKHAIQRRRYKLVED